MLSRGSGRNPERASASWSIPLSPAFGWCAICRNWRPHAPCAMLRAIVLDNGPELTSKAIFFWSQRTGIKLNFIQPGKPPQNAFVESFNGRFRDGCLNQHWFQSLAAARQIINAWQHHYNHDRPHSSLGYRSSIQFELQPP